jgi:hypothetical protein
MTRVFAGAAAVIAMSISATNLQAGEQIWPLPDQKPADLPVTESVMLPPDPPHRYIGSCVSMKTGELTSNAPDFSYIDYQGTQSLISSIHSHLMRYEGWSSNLQRLDRLGLQLDQMCFAIDRLGDGEEHIYNEKPSGDIDYYILIDPHTWKQGYDPEFQRHLLSTYQSAGLALQKLNILPYQENGRAQLWNIYDYPDAGLTYAYDRMAESMADMDHLLFATQSYHDFKCHVREIKLCDGIEEDLNKGVEILDATSPELAKDFRMLFVAVAGGGVESLRRTFMGESLPDLTAQYVWEDATGLADALSEEEIYKSFPISGISNQEDRQITKLFGDAGDQLVANGSYPISQIQTAFWQNIRVKLRGTASGAEMPETIPDNF